MEQCAFAANTATGSGESRIQLKTAWCAQLCTSANPYQQASTPGPQSPQTTQGKGRAPFLLTTAIGRATLDSLESIAYALKGVSWARMSDMLAPRTFLAAAVLGSNLYST
eukprot:scaffold300544_cov40-Tisochrysis_lutea.AAC.2